MLIFTCRHSIEDDILNLMDEVDIDEFLKEAAMAIDDAEKLSEFIREKATIAIERFLVSLELLSRFCLCQTPADLIPSKFRFDRITYPKCPYPWKSATLVMDGC